MSPWPLFITVVIMGAQLMAEIAARMNGSYNPAQHPVTAADFWVGIGLLMLTIYAAVESAR